MCPAPSSPIPIDEVTRACASGENAILAEIRQQQAPAISPRNLAYIILFRLGGSVSDRYCDIRCDTKFKSNRHQPPNASGVAIRPTHKVGRVVGISNVVTRCDLQSVLVGHPDFNDEPDAGHALFCSIHSMSSLASRGFTYRAERPQFGLLES